MTDSKKEATTAIQPHFDMDEWKEAGKPKSGEAFYSCLNRGFDIFATNDYFYIVRSDLDTPMFMRISGLHDPKYKGKIFLLPEGYHNGDHYFGDSSVKYMIQGHMVHSSTDFQTDYGNITDKPLPESALNGMHYFVYKGALHKIVGDTLHKYSGIYSGTHKSSYTIHPKLRNAAAYFTLGDYFYVMKMVDTGGGNERFCFYKVKSLERDPGYTYKTVNRSIQLFLPGGYTQNSPAVAVWEEIGYIDNQTNGAFTYEHEFKYSHGHDTSKTREMEHHWEIEIEQSVEVGTEIAKSSLKMNRKYGGSQTDTKTSEWHQSSEETIKVTIEIAKGKKKVFFQPTVKLGGESTVIAGRHLVITDGKQPDYLPWE